jgi:serine/threonine-protein kinase
MTLNKPGQSLQATSTEKIISSISESSPTPEIASIQPTISPHPLQTPTSLPPSPPASIPSETKVWEKDKMAGIYVPAGDFLMGSSDDDKDLFFWIWERPQHKVFLDAFWIDKTEVTNEMFTRFTEASGYKTDAEKKGKAYVYKEKYGRLMEVNGANWRHPFGLESGIDGLDNHPVVQVSWNDAKTYCEWAGRRLPSEAEWEKAARGTDGRKYPWGSEDNYETRLNYCDKNCNSNSKDNKEDDGYSYTAPVGSYPNGASPYGALDMAGNVWEWVNDWHGEKYYSSSPQRNPQGPSSGTYRVTRGGSWIMNMWGCRPTLRNRDMPDTGIDNRGFRCAQQG